VHVSALFVYPVKGAAGISLMQAELDEFGIHHDRRWMVVDAAGRFITPRHHPRLALVRTALTGTALVLAAPGAGELRLPLQRALDGPGPSGARTVRARVWLDDVDAIDAGNDAASFLTAWLGFAVRLVYMPTTTVRPTDPAYSRPGDRVSFADGFPLLLIGQSSLDELNRRLEEPVPMLRFRPNIVVAGAEPHAEDGWRRIRIGAVECDVVKPCGRCVVTTLDLATAVAGPEPLRTLATYRRREGQVYFGQNVIHRATGTVAVGAAVDVLADTG
jgi:uncharacterized protein